MQGSQTHWPVPLHCGLAFPPVHETEPRDVRRLFKITASVACCPCAHQTSASQVWEVMWVISRNAGLRLRRHGDPCREREQRGAGGRAEESQEPLERGSPAGGTHMYECGHSQRACHTHEPHRCGSITDLGFKRPSDGTLSLCISSRLNGFWALPRDLGIHGGPWVSS